MKLASISLLVALSGAGGAHAGSFTPPAGCETFLTVQSRGCRVSNHYICSADPAGDQWRADFDQEGMFFLSHIDREGQWLESTDKGTGVRQWLEPGAGDPASFSNLLATGRDDFDFGLNDDTGTRTRVQGYDQMSGKTITIDGVPLKETSFAYSESSPDGTVLRRAHGHEFVSEEWRLFFAGPSFWDGGEGEVPMDGSPVKLIRAGQPGFAATQPIFDCDAVMSQGPLAPDAMVPVALPVAQGGLGR